MKRASLSSKIAKLSVCLIFLQNSGFLFNRLETQQKPVRFTISHYNPGGSQGTCGTGDLVTKIAPDHKRWSLSFFILNCVDTLMRKKVVHKPV